MSKGWKDVGYHYVIPKTGEIQKGRDEGAVGAHCKEQSMNHHSIGICLTGNFDNYEPNEAQFESLISLTKDIMKRHNISIEHIKKHCDYAHYKSCPGKVFPWERFISKLKDNEHWGDKYIKKLKELEIISSEHKGNETVEWGEFAVTLLKSIDFIKGTDYSKL
jgi:N-acetyl-anhydromuramyl-L-alanine amidase AmpD